MRLNQTNNLKNFSWAWWCT